MLLLVVVIVVVVAPPPPPAIVVVVVLVVVVALYYYYYNYILPSSIGGIRMPLVYATFFLNSRTTWAATLRLRGSTIIYVHNQHHYH